MSPWAMAGPTVRNADVVDQHLDLVRRNGGADLAFDGGEPHLRLFDSRAGRTARVQPHLAGIHRGEEILAHQPRQAERRQEEGPEDQQHAPAMPQGPIQQADVAEPQGLEHRVEQIVAADEDALPAGASRLLSWISDPSR